MQLLGSFTSPFVRRVRVVVLEKGLQDQVALVETNPFANGAELLEANPLGKVPALLGAGPGALYDSRVICEYLDQLNPEPALLPDSGPERWEVLRRQALAEGIMDAAAAHVMESRREDGMVSAHWQGRREESMLRGALELARLQSEHAWPLDLGSIASAVALAYLDFRHAQVDWRGHCPGLAAWLDVFSQRPSMQASRPPA